jgi:transposase InsO family protein
MFSLFHKDASTPVSLKPGDSARASAQQIADASTAAAAQRPAPTVDQPGPQALEGGLVRPPLTTDAASAMLARQTDEPQGGPLDRLDVGSQVTNGGAATRVAPQAVAREEASSSGPSIPWVAEATGRLAEDDDGDVADREPPEEREQRPVRLTGRRPGTRMRPPQGRELRLPEDAKRRVHTPQQRLMILDTWRRSGLPALDFASLVGIAKDTLYKWKQLFEEHGPAGLLDQPRGAREGSRLPELTKRTILMLKEQHPEWGCQRISDLLLRGPALPASASAVARVLWEAGYESTEEPTHPHPDHVRRFERAQPNHLWQTDLFTFVLKRHNRRVYLVAFLDDHSRFIVSYGLHASQSTAVVLEVLEAGLASYGPPEEILTDNGTQYITWRGKSQFTRRLEQRGIRQLVSRPQHPQTLGKIKRFWGTLWRELLETAIFADLTEARTRIGHFIDYYNTTSSGRIAARTVWCRRIGSSRPPRPCSRRSRSGWRQTL